MADDTTQLTDFKSTELEFSGMRIVDLATRPNDPIEQNGNGLTAAELKAYFDYIPITVLALTKINGMIDFLIENGGGTLGVDEIEGLTEAASTVREVITALLAMVNSNKENIETALDNLAGEGRTDETVKQNAGDIETIKGTGWTAETVKNNADQITAMKGEGWTSENLKTIADTLTAFIAQKAVANGLASLNSEGKLAQGIDGSNITSGEIPLWAIPDAAKERVYLDCTTVDEMYLLTVSDVQDGDTILIAGTTTTNDDGDAEITADRWFRVVDQTLLSSDGIETANAGAFREMSVGTAMAEIANYYNPNATGETSIAVAIANLLSQLETANANISALDASKSDLSSEVTATLLSTSWTGTDAPFTYTLSVSGVTASSNQEILPQTKAYFSTNSDYIEYIEALQSANLQDNGQAEGAIYLCACGDVPTMDLPIKIIFRGD